MAQEKNLILFPGGVICSGTKLLHQLSEDGTQWGCHASALGEEFV